MKNIFVIQIRAMRKNVLLILLCSVLLFACSKDSSNNQQTYGNTLNTWTFKEGNTVYNGSLLLGGASLNTQRQSNNSYTFSMLGPEKTSGFLFNLTLSLLDLNFTQKQYKSGVDGNDYLNAFYYMESPASVDNIYKSSNLDPGPVMNYTITAYDANKDIVTIEFSGQAQLANGSLVSITNGKVTAQVER
jgi:hypothetical protein